VSPMFIPDQAKTIDDQAGFIRIMTDEAGLRAHAGGHIAAKGRMLPCRKARGFICVEIIRRRGIGHIGELDIAETIDCRQRIPPGPHVPAGHAQQVPDQPRPEDRPDMVEETLEIRMHGLEARCRPSL
jgi:hypothetical protein